MSSTLRPFYYRNMQAFRETIVDLPGWLKGRICFELIAPINKEDKGTGIGNVLFAKPVSS